MEREIGKLLKQKKKDNAIARYIGAIDYNFSVQAINFCRN